jgi:uncharacterized protein YggE
VEREVVVRGAGEVRTLPDRATVRVTVDGDGSSQSEAYDAAARIAGDVDAVLAGHADLIERVVTTALLVQPRTRWHSGESVRTGWRAGRTSTVDVHGLDRLGNLLAALAGAGAAIDGPTWGVAADNAAHDEARRSAAADARRRAEAYATALGVTLGAVAWVAEPGLRIAGSPGPFDPGVHALMAPAMAADDTIDLEPAEITIRVSVDVAFTIDET